MPRFCRGIFNMLRTILLLVHLHSLRVLTIHVFNKVNTLSKTCKINDCYVIIDAFLP